MVRKKKMERKTIYVCVFVGILGIAAAVAGFAAEATRVKVTVVNNGIEIYCEYPSSPAMGFAIGATVALVLARTIIASASGGCCSCCRTIPDLAKLARDYIFCSCYPIYCWCETQHSKRSGHGRQWCVLLWNDKAWDLLRSWYHGSRGCASLYSVLPLLCVGFKRLSQNINGRTRGATNY
uniref:Uncharacterized protein n=1 Tax=Lactuca sativa TaxID=4236 RepID=A0A9R1X807_LACSA|nr:hypothetical protein LSAT_V11C600332120 [Lactuca sativa]